MTELIEYDPNKNTIKFYFDEIEQVYYCYIVEMPTVKSFGKTEGEAFKNLLDLLFQNRGPP